MGIIKNQGKYEANIYHVLSNSLGIAIQHTNLPSNGLTLLIEDIRSLAMPKDIKFDYNYSKPNTLSITLILTSMDNNTILLTNHRHSPALKELYERLPSKFLLLMSLDHLLKETHLPYQTFMHLT